MYTHFEFLKKICWIWMHTCIDNGKTSKHGIRECRHKMMCMLCFNFLPLSKYILSTVINIFVCVTFSFYCFFVMCSIRWSLHRFHYMTKWLNESMVNKTVWVFTLLLFIEFIRKAEGGRRYSNYYENVYVFFFWNVLRLFFKSAGTLKNYKLSKKLILVKKKI